MVTIFGNSGEAALEAGSAVALTISAGWPETSKAPSGPIRRDSSVCSTDDPSKPLFKVKVSVKELAVGWRE